MEPGTRDITVRKDYLLESHGSVTVDAGDYESVSIYPGGPAGGLSVTTSPAGADVLLDGEDIGETPYLSRNIAPGSYDVRIELIGHVPYDDTVDIVSGQDTVIDITLDPVPKPDLYVSLTNWIPAEPETTGGFINFQCTIYNGGTVAAYDVVSKLIIDGTEYSLDADRDYQPGQGWTSMVSISPASLGAGEHSVTCRADAPDEIDESAESNNDKTRTLTIYPPRPDLYPSNINWNPQEPTIDISYINLQCTIWNNGTVDATDVENKIWVDGQPYDVDGTRDYTPGQGWTQFAYVQPASIGVGNHDVICQADYPGDWDEKNELNNNLSATMEVLPTTTTTTTLPPTCSGAELTIDEVVEDSYAVKNNPLRSYGNNNQIQVYSFRTPYTTRGYIMFDIKSVPDSIGVQSAHLYVYPENRYLRDNGTQDLISVYHVLNDSWEEGPGYNAGDVSWPDLTWDSQPCGIDFDDSTQCSMTPDSQVRVQDIPLNTMRIFDVTNMVRADHASADNLISIAMKTEEPMDEDNVGIYWASKESSYSHRRPYLKVCLNGTTTTTTSSTTTSSSSSTSTSSSTTSSTLAGCGPAVECGSSGTCICGSACDGGTVSTRFSPEPCDCSDGTNEAYMYVSDVMVEDLNGKSYEIGDTVRVTAEVYCYSTGTEVAIAYNDGSGWTNQLYTNCPSSGTNTFQVEFPLTGTAGTHTFRAMESWTGTSGMTCDSTDAYADHDDITVQVLAGSGTTTTS